MMLSTKRVGGWKVRLSGWLGEPSLRPILEFHGRLGINLSPPVSFLNVASLATQANFDTDP